MALISRGLLFRALRPVLLVVLLCLLAFGAHATAIINGPTSANATGTVSGTTGTALAEASDSASSNPSSFSVNLFLPSGLGDETKDSVAITFEDGGWVEISGVAYLPLIYDLQETNNNEDVTIGSNPSGTFEGLKLCIGAACGDAGSTELWASTEDILLNTDPTLGEGNVVPDDADLTDKPLGNGADFALFVPLSIFDGEGLTGTDTFWMEATQTNSNDGNDEWTLSDEGINPLFTSTIFNPGDSISSAIVPEPSTTALLAIGLGGLAALGRRRS